MFCEAGLLKNIGDGVQDFFYEPYLGLQQSPTNFVIGVGKGTGSKEFRCWRIYIHILIRIAYVLNIS